MRIFLSVAPAWYSRPRMRTGRGAFEGGLLSSPSVVAQPSLKRYWYGANIAEFLKQDCDSIIGALSSGAGFDAGQNQGNAWLEQVALLRRCLAGLDGWLCFEYSIPRMGRRIDAVVITGPAVFVLEFKVGATEFERAAVEQVWDYALDLKNFHEASHNAAIVPTLIATDASNSPSISLEADADGVYRPICVTAALLRPTIDRALQVVKGVPLYGPSWSTAPYRPTPTIIEAARALYGQHSVEAIARSDAGAQNLRVTSGRIEELAEDAKRHSRKTICFVTGVPGAGKTLVGLNVATQRRDADQDALAVFLSGNGPLVAVLREALTRDEVTRRKLAGEKVRKGQVGESVKAFIQNVHHFRDDKLSDVGPPVERVAIFDEAQRAWNLKQTASFMQRKKGHPNFSQSEPEFLISCMDRHKDWGVIVCLVGGGQEINTGEAGIDAWLDAVNANFPKWHMHISSNLTDSEYAAGKTLDMVAGRPNTHFDDDLHLAVSMRSFRAENVSAFVKALLDIEHGSAQRAFEELASRYPLALTRDLDAAKEWVRGHARGSERYGMVASSSAHRLKPDAIDIRVDVDPIHYFLNDRNDTRSSYYMEDAATEFQVQGLELDWACVAWDGDLRFGGNAWDYNSFRGDSWCKVKNVDRQRYLCNAYRVLLTRARQGMVVYVPRGSSKDRTRAPEYYDKTFQYLADLGIPAL